MNDETHSKALSRRRMMQMAGGAAAAGIGLPLATHNSAAADLIPKASTPGTSPGDVFSENA